MKVLIWIGCIFVNAIITTLFKQNGIILGAIPTVLLYLGAVYLARYLCKLWDERKTEKKIQEGKNTFKHKNYFCKECGQRLIDQGKFCNKCGSVVSEPPINDGKFCVKCGTNIAHDVEKCHVCFAEIYSKKL